MRSIINNHGTGVFVPGGRNIHLWRQRYQSRRELAQWSDRELHDVGISWSDVAYEAENRSGGLNGSQAGVASPEGRLRFFLKPMGACDGDPALRRPPAYSDVLRSRHGQEVTVASSSRAMPRRCKTIFARSRPAPLQPLPRRGKRTASVAARGFHPCREADRFSVVATMLVDGYETHRRRSALCVRQATPPQLEFGLSIDDRWQGHGIGKALMKNLECRAALVRRRAAVRRHAALPTTP